MHSPREHSSFPMDPASLLRRALVTANWKRIVYVAGSLFIIALLALYLRAVKIADERGIVRAPAPVVFDPQTCLYDVTAIATTRDVTQVHPQCLSEPMTKTTRCAATSESGPFVFLSIVCAVTGDRYALLQSSLASWLDVEGVDEVILVDWHSDVVLSSYDTELPLLNNPRVRVVKFDGNEKYSLSGAINLGLKLSRGAFILKVEPEVGCVFCVTVVCLITTMPRYA